jgi:soluble lytic murein transglycosylase-like protein
MCFCLILAWAPLAAPAIAESSDSGQRVARMASVVHVDAQTGRLVRAIGPPPDYKKGAGARAEVAASLGQYVRETAEHYQVDPLLVRSVIEVESNYDQFAVSAKGAQGLMQLMPDTARRLGVQNSFNPYENIDGGVRYLKYLLGLFGDQETPEKLALAAYNAGEGAVIKHGGVPPYRETTQYVSKVAKKWDEARSGAAAAQPSPAETQPVIEEFVDAQGRLHIRTRPTP